MLTAWIFIGMAFAAPEIILVENTAWLKRFMNSDPRIEFFASIPFNLALGAVMAIPAGVNIAIGGIFAAGITTIWYKLDPLVRYKQIKAYGLRQYKVARTKVHNIRVGVRIVTWPVRGLVEVVRQGIAVYNKITSYKPERSEGAVRR